MFLFVAFSKIGPYIFDDNDPRRRKVGAEMYIGHIKSFLIEFLTCFVDFVGLMTQYAVGGGPDNQRTEI